MDCTLRRSLVVAGGLFASFLRACSLGRSLFVWALGAGKTCSEVNACEDCS